MHFTSFDALLALAVVLPTSLVSAAPTTDSLTQRSPWWGSNNNNNNKNDDNPLSAIFDFAKRFQGSPNPSMGACSVSQAQMPQCSPPLPQPAAGLHPYHIAIGRGTQNYTCDLSNSTAIPVAQGALATLFNVSCIAADAPALLNTLPSIAINLPDPSGPGGQADQELLARDISGHHYFIDEYATPYFNLKTADHDFGQGGFKKANTSSAPKNAMIGQYGRGDGAAPWLKLQAKDPKGQVFQEVYRVNTAGGQPPVTCQGMQAEFQVQYSAEYWFFA